MSKCPCGGVSLEYPEDGNDRPRESYELCTLCLFSWGVKG